MTIPKSSVHQLH